MATGTGTGGDTELPIIPAPRATGCPLEPPPAFAHWREADGLQRAMWQGHVTWVVSRYRDIRAALVDTRLSAETIPDSMKQQSDDVAVIFPRTDDPEHNRLRRMMTGDFTVKRAKEMQPQVQALVDGFLDDMIAGGPPTDLVSAFALPLPSLVISLLLGVPYEDLERFQHYSTVGLDSQSTEGQRLEAVGAMFGYLAELVARKEKEPGDDLISRLINDHVLSGELSRATAAMNGMILLQAGHETTASMIALGTVALLEQPEVYARLGATDHPQEIADIVEELLRYLSIVHSLVDRVALEDIELGGQLIRAGDSVLMNLPAGNWDPDFIPDPESFDPDRSVRGHLAFGYGVHQCIGQHLARLELQLALSTLARRLPRLRLAVPPEQLRFRNEQGIYDIAELPVTW